MVLASHPNPEAPVLSHFSLAGKTAIITGGCRGIGLEVARGLCEAGAKVAITYSSTPPEEANEIAAKISSANDGRLVKAYKCNVRSVADIEATVDTVIKELGDGRLDIMVANAGISKNMPAIDYPEDKFREMFDINVNGAFWAAQAAAHVFEKQSKADGAPFRGSIIFTASVSATLVNIPQKQAAYNSSKAALVHLSKSLAVEWVDFARVNSISPGFIDTEMLDVHPQEWRSVWNEMIPGRRFCKPAELKGIYVFVASDASSYMTGADLIIDGGYTLP
ncbi:NAD(P)-binding protein [Annulohypoxylon truncatum]|uniref:NAD(P)-binding protein n=1 Tax=Annulohypoxylon truncatum TaxID=327061 RepID=UPI0020072731|nr:NAD(P)-binding protein [Annulohypoxylon truncatum]KAI1208149.1 NAD(P)-binding protein [Annulohypoxylon truncatum]